MGFIANIDEFKTDSTTDQILDYLKYDLYSIKWNETAQDQTLQVRDANSGLAVGLSNGYAIIGNLKDGLQELRSSTNKHFTEHGI